MRSPAPAALAALASFMLVAGASAQSLLGVDSINRTGSPARPVARQPNPPLPAVQPPRFPPIPQPPSDANGWLGNPPPLAHSPYLQGALDAFMIAWAAWRDLPDNHPQKALYYVRVQHAKADFDRLRTSSSTIYRDLPAAVAAFAVTYRVAWQWPANSTNGIAAKFRYQEAFKDIEKISASPWGSVDYNEIKRHYAFWAARRQQFANNPVEREIARIAVDAYQKQWSTPRRQVAQR